MGKHSLEHKVSSESQNVTDPKPAYWEGTDVMKHIRPETSSWPGRVGGIAVRVGAVASMAGGVWMMLEGINPLN